MLARDGIAAPLFPLLLVGLLAAMTFWLERAAQVPLAGQDGKSRHDPDYLIDRFSVQRFGVDGELQHTLRAAHMRHYPDDDSTTVLQPQLTYHRSPPTTVTAREARLNSGATEVTLIDDVVVTRGSANGKPASILSTSRLLAYPEEETATTDAPVTITQGMSQVSGSGLRANNVTAQYELLGRVNGIFHRQAGAAATPAPPAAAFASSAKAATPKASPKPVPRKKKAAPKPKKRRP